MTNVQEIFSPGRIEIIGNHTDHQGGQVLAMTIPLGIRLHVQATDDQIITITSDGHDPIKIDIADTSRREDETATSAALVRGIADGFCREGLTVGGISAHFTSDLPEGQGLSSSACFEIACCKIFNQLYNQGSVPPLQLARIAQRAEREYFGKDCGLLDQLIIAEGGAALLDFSDGGECCPFDFSPQEFGYVFCLILTRSNHTADTRNYSSIPASMFAVAHELGAKRLGDVEEKAFSEQRSQIADKLGWEVVNRAIHFFTENRRVKEFVEATEKKELRTVLNLLRASAASSATLLGNVTPEQIEDLTYCDMQLALNGATRIQGGGGGGALLTLLPEADYPRFAHAMEERFGAGCCYRI